jgi:hypothetical protein
MDLDTEGKKNAECFVIKQPSLAEMSLDDADNDDDDDGGGGGGGGGVSLEQVHSNKG